MRRAYPLCTKVCVALVYVNESNSGGGEGIRSHTLVLYSITSE